MINFNITKIKGVLYIVLCLKMNQASTMLSCNEPPCALRNLKSIMNDLLILALKEFDEGAHYCSNFR